MGFEGWNSAGWPLQNAASVWAEREAEGATGSPPAKWECRSPHFEDRQPHSNVYGIWEATVLSTGMLGEKEPTMRVGCCLEERMKVIEGLCI